MNYEQLRRLVANDLQENRYREAPDNIVDLVIESDRFEKKVQEIITEEEDLK